MEKEQIDQLEKVAEILQGLPALLQQLGKEDEKWVGANGCARRLGISIATLRKKLWAWKNGNVALASPIGRDIIPYHPNGCDWRFEKKQIDVYILKNRIE